MNITIEQTLHGYFNGHQLLAASMELTAYEKKILLYQSDLSGSSIEDEFKTYISGYPIKETNRYAFAKSWYADEMQRPGCVWTHTLLINFSDLGKIPELDILFDFFKRPVISEYEYYEMSVLIPDETLKSLIAHTVVSREEVKRNIFSSLYGEAEKTIIIPTKNPSLYENTIVEIWSDQWPRLRRQFSFCTGALSFKKFDNQEFDLLIIPPSKLNLIQRQSKSIYVLNPKANLSADIFDIYKEFPKISIRSFLWIYGADIEGSRKNFIPLLTIFEALHDKKITLSKIAKQLNQFFPSSSEARNFKNKIFGPGSILRSKFTEKEIVEFLVTSENIDSIDDARISIEARLQDLIKRKEIPLNDFLSVLKNAQPDRVSSQIWESIDFSNLDVIGLLETNQWLIDILIAKDSEFIYSTRTWKLDLELQEMIFDKLITSSIKIDWSRFVVAILNAESEIIFEAARINITDVVLISLEWLNSNNSEKTLITEWSRELANRHSDLLRDWVFENKNNLSAKLFALFFAYLPIGRILRFNFSSRVWIKAYNDLKENNYQVNLVFLSCFVLTIGFENRIDGSVDIVCESFHDVFSYAASARLDSNLWNLIPKDSGNDDYDDQNIVETLSNFFGLSAPKKKSQIADWDYCEILIRTLVNKFIRYSWDRQIFLDTLKNTHAFRRAVEYCFSFKKGRKFLYRVVLEVQRGHIKAASFQNGILSRYEIG